MEAVFTFERVEQEVHTFGPTPSRSGRMKAGIHFSVELDGLTHPGGYVEIQQPRGTVFEEESVERSTLKMPPTMKPALWPHYRTLCHALEEYYRANFGVRGTVQIDKGVGNMFMAENVVAKRMKARIPLVHTEEGGGW